MSGKNLETDLLLSLGQSFMKGPVYLGAALEQTGQLYFFNASSAFPTILQGGNATSASTYTFPAALPASNGSAFVSSTTGTISFIVIDSGTYTPTLTNTTNVSASTPRLSTYLRIGNSVTVSGQFDIDPTAAGAVLMGISLPIVSNLTTAFQLGGVASSTTIVNESAGIEGDATNDRASLKYVAVDTSNHTMTFTFTYQVL